MDNKDKIYEMEINNGSNGEEFRIQNSKKVLAIIGDVLLDKLNYYRWNNVIKFFDKYEQKRSKRGS